MSSAIIRRHKPLAPALVDEILELRFIMGWSYKQISELRQGMPCKRTISEYCKMYIQAGCQAKYKVGRFGSRSSIRLFDGTTTQYLVELVMEQELFRLKDIAHHLERRTGKVFSEAAVSRGLKENGFVLLMCTNNAAERDEAARTAFVNHIKSTYTRKQFLFLDGMVQDMNDSSLPGS